MRATRAPEAAALARLRRSRLYSEELGIELARGDDRELFKWFLASILFGHRIAGPLRRLAQHARAEVFLRILELGLLGDGQTIVAHERRAPFLLDRHRFGLGTEGDAHRIGELRCAVQDLFARLRAEQDLLGSHGVFSSSSRSDIPAHLSNKLEHTPATGFDRGQTASDLSIR
ncbi:MAG TPA: hypothetical protein VI543_02895 [Sulfuricaulis sp.]|jgi:hypothetical protein|nr:hypothetical protein [Sulfuricaulis sp.]